MSEGTTTIYTENEDVLYSKPLEQFVSSICDGTTGHALSTTFTGTEKKLIVTFNDSEPYFKESGVFSVSNVTKTKYRY